VLHCDLLHLNIRKLIIKEHLNINLDSKTIIFDENDMSIIKYHGNVSPVSQEELDVYELNLNVENREIIRWDRINENFKFKLKSKTNIHDQEYCIIQ